MTQQLATAMRGLAPTQRQAVQWNDDPALVLAGPGIGKTTILTLRIARILHSSPKRHFRILALTCTKKAGDEMQKRVEELVPELVERTVIGTFHAFCTQILRQHGSHLGIKPDFGIYALDSDRKALLRDALAAAPPSAGVSPDDVRWLVTIDQLRNRLVPLSEVAERFPDRTTGQRVAQVYQIYETALQQQNVTDFHGMLLNTCRLLQHMPAVAARIRQTYPYWLIDEFQDTLPAQYRLMCLMAGNDFRNIFAVADDDQIIYQWAGASYDQIVKFRQQFSPRLFQIIENRRCPPAVVQAANSLVGHNTARTCDKEPSVAIQESRHSAICLQAFTTDRQEAQGIAIAIAAASPSTWGRTAILGRTRAVLKPVQAALEEHDVKVRMVQRRDQFLSPQFVWLQACLEQCLRPTDRQVFARMVHAGNKMGSTAFDPTWMETEATAQGQGFLEHWALAACASSSEIARHLGQWALQLVESRASWRTVRDEALAWLPQTADTDHGTTSDVCDDKAAWIAASNTARASHGGNIDLAQLLQSL